MGWWPCGGCICPGGCEDCNNCSWSVVLAGFTNGTCSYCSSIDGTYALSASDKYDCDAQAFEPISASPICNSYNGCVCHWEKTFTITDVCSGSPSTQSLSLQLTLCCDAIVVIAHYSFGGFPFENSHHFIKTKTAGDYSGCSISSLSIPWSAQKKPISVSYYCNSNSGATATITATCPP